MATDFGFLGANADALLDETIRLYQPDLHAAGVKIGIRGCTNPDGDAVSHAGYAAYAKIAIVPPKWRLLTPFDAIIDVDAIEFTDFEPESRLALFHHETSHVAIVPKKNRATLEIVYKEDCEKAAQAGEPPPLPPRFWKSDGMGRPKLKSVKAEWNVGDGFLSVCRSHGRSAIEWINLEIVYAMAKKAIEEGEKERQNQKTVDTVAFKRKAN